MDDKLSIRVNIAERFYPLRIEREEEERIRKAAKLINEKIAQYRTHYSDKDVQDFISMAALQFVIKMLELEENQDPEPLIDKMRDLDTYLSNILEEE